MLPFYLVCFYGTEKAVTRTLPILIQFNATFDAADISFLWVSLVQDFQILTIVVINLNSFVFWVVPAINPCLLSVLVLYFL
jgi:hypothetical protein